VCSASEDVEVRRDFKKRKRTVAELTTEFQIKSLEFLFHYAPHSSPTEIEDTPMTAATSLSDEAPFCAGWSACALPYRVARDPSLAGCVA
jgi:hypothetical protein